MAQHFDPFSALIPNSRAYEQGKFGRMFSWLPPLAEDTPATRSDLLKLAQIINDTHHPEGGDKGVIPVGYTYLGQFIIHDISFDPTSINERHVDPEFLWNFRTPALDLDSIYGGGPKVMPYLYDPSPRNNYGASHFLISKDLLAEPSFYDVPRLQTPPRNTAVMAVIADPRNDEHVIISQLHLAFLLFHNSNEVDAIKIKKSTDSDEIYRIARLKVQWHYQWVLLYDYLPRIIDLDVFKVEIEEGQPNPKLSNSPENVRNMNRLISRKEKLRKFFDWRNEPFIPLEFSAAAFRFGHSMVLDEYRFNNEKTGSLFPENAGDPGFNSDKTAFTHIDWSFFFPEIPDQFDNMTRISPSLTEKLKKLPNPALRTNNDEAFENTIQRYDNKDINSQKLRAEILEQGMMVNERNLAARNLMRGLMLRLPSGQSVAKAMEIHEEKILEEIDEIPERFKDNTPLWYYILKEAEVNKKGKLGPVGSRIVGEVIIGLIQGDKSSFLNQFPNWLPDKVSGNSGSSYTMADLLKEAGVYNGALESDL